MSTQRILAALLGLQLVFVVVAWWPRASQPRLQPVFGMERDQVDVIEIAPRPADDAEEDAIVLARSEDGWVVRSAADYPADRAKVEEVLDAALSLRAGPPIATSEASHESFSVGDESYGRRLELRAGDDSTNLLIGPATSRSVYLRRVGSDDVFRATGASEWAFNDRASAYWDPLYVSQDPSALGALVLSNAHGELRFVRGDGGWTLADLAEGESVDAESIDELIDSVTQVRMKEPVGRDEKEAYGLDGGAARVDWTVVAEDQSLAGGYRVGAEVDGDVYLQAVGNPFVVRVAAGNVERLRNAQRGDFLE